jgi:ribosomal protein L7/L12
VFTVLEVSDFAIIVLAVVFAAGAAAAFARLRPADPDQLVLRVEHKLDLIMTHLGLDYATSLHGFWQDLANDPTRRVSAIKAYREQHGVGLAKAKWAVEEYVREHGGRAIAAAPAATSGDAGTLPRPAGRDVGRPGTGAPADPLGQAWEDG